MEEVSLYRKYRPHNFDNLVGQDHVKFTLINAIKSGHVSHAYLFTGPRGTGKTSTARLLAKALTCDTLHLGFDPCDKCEFCQDINEGRLIDLIEIDAASNRGIDEVRDLKEKINFAPTRAKCKVYIIDEVHMMTKEAFNALLKTLEEPPSHTYFVLATTEVHKIPETIISRCQRFDFKRVATKALMTRLSFISQKEKIEAEDSALEAISKYANGGLRDAIGLLEQLTLDGKLSFERVQEILGLSNLSVIESLYELLVKNETAEALNVVHELHSQGSDLKQFTVEFIEGLRERMLASVAEGKMPLTVRLIEMIRAFQEAQQKSESSIPQLSLEIAIIQLSEAFVVSGQEEIGRKNEEIAQESLSLDESRKHQGARSTVSHLEAKLISEPLTIDTVKKNWPRIVERVKIPALKMSLKNGTPLYLEESNIHLQFETNFHRDKVMEHDHRVELEEAMKDVFEADLKVMAKVKSLEIAAVVEDERNVKSGKVLDEALEIFGGEVVG